MAFPSYRLCFHWFFSVRKYCLFDKIWCKRLFPYYRHSTPKYSPCYLFNRIDVVFLYLAQNYLYLLHLSPHRIYADFLHCKWHHWHAFHSFNSPCLGKNSSWNLEFMQYFILIHNRKLHSVSFGKLFRQKIPSNGNHFSARFWTNWIYPILLPTRNHLKKYADFKKFKLILIITLNSFLLLYMFPERFWHFFQTSFWVLPLSYLLFHSLFLSSWCLHTPNMYLHIMNLFLPLQIVPIHRFFRKLLLLHTKTAPLLTILFQTRRKTFRQKRLLPSVWRSIISLLVKMKLYSCYCKVYPYLKYPNNLLSLLIQSSSTIKTYTKN